MPITINDFKPANQFAQLFGVKALIYGGAGTGKTPIINTAPNPCMIAVEPGMLSMRGSSIAAVQAETTARVDDFIRWVTGSNEAKVFETVAIDSVSEMMEMKVRELFEKTPNRHGLQVYGEAGQWVQDHMDTLYRLQNKHMYLICKLAIDKDEDGGAVAHRPYFAGRMLNTTVPHLFDEILYLNRTMVPGAGEQLCFQTGRSHNVMARDRTGNLAMYEPPDFGHIVRKCMGQQ